MDMAITRIIYLDKRVFTYRRGHTQGTSRDRVSGGGGEARESPLPRAVAAGARGRRVWRPAPGRRDICGSGSSPWACFLRMFSGSRSRSP